MMPVRWATVVCVTLSLSSPLSSDEPITSEEAWDRGWPTMQGPSGNFDVPSTGGRLVDDLSNARLLWESEDRDFGRAKHTTGTFKAKTSEGRVQKILDTLGPNPIATPGGWAAPIIAEGKLFASTFKPAGKLFDVKTMAYDEQSKRNPAVAKAHLEADDMVIALDVKTGKTLWKARESGGLVWGVGKRMGFQVAPVYHQGRVFSRGTTGRVFAYRAADGKKLWQTEADATMLKEKQKHLALQSILQASTRYGWQQSLVFAGDTLIVPMKSTLRGIDPETGNPKWELEKVISQWATPSVWQYSGKSYLLCATERDPGKCHLNLIDPAAGKVVWSVGGLDATFFNLSPTADHVFVNVGSTQFNKTPNGSWPRYPDGSAPFGRLGAFRITDKGASLAWTLPDEPAYVFGTGADSHARPRIIARGGLVFHTTAGPDKENDRRLIIASESTGKVLAELPRDSDFWFQVIEDKLLYCRDWSHGKRASWHLYSTDPKDFRHLSGPWSTEQPLTTSYQVFMEPPVIAGHIFLRTETGSVVCYDLRKK